jgi:hypothetical protein
LLALVLFAQLLVGHVQVTGLPQPSKAKAIVVNSGEGCKGSEIVEGLPASGLLYIHRRVDRNCWCTDPMAGLAIMAPGKGFTYASAGDICAKGPKFTVPMRPLREVILEVWSKSPELEILAKDDVTYVDWIFSNNLAGLTLRPHFNPPDEKVSGLTCESAEKSATYVKGKINLYYGGVENMSCPNGGIVLVHDVPILGDGAHELGHQLGLNVRDTHDPPYFTGHTTDRQPFQCDNVMWTKSDVLKHDVSPGQSFWLNLSCSSPFNDPAGCLACSSEADAKSPCPPFALGRKDDRGRACGSCTLEEAKRLLSLNPAPGLRVVNRGRSQLCDRGTVQQRLVERYRTLIRYLKDRSNLTLGSTSLTDFVRRWSELIGVVLTVEAVAAQPDPASGVQFLKEQIPLKDRDYIAYAIQKIKENDYRPRCALGTVISKLPQ